MLWPPRVYFVIEAFSTHIKKQHDVMTQEYDHFVSKIQPRTPSSINF